MESHEAFPMEGRVSWSVSSDSSDPEHFVETTMALKAPIGTEVGDYRTESPIHEASFACWWDHRLGQNKSEHEPKHDLSPQVWAKMPAM